MKLRLFFDKINKPFSQINQKKERRHKIIKLEIKKWDYNEYQ